jgi:uncharacterized protein YndB with AHSA1/START domain
MSTQAQVTVTTPSDREIMMARAFDAPRSVVFDCYTKPELLKRWLHGPGGWLLTICDTDLRVGGTFRWVWRHAESGEMSIHGVYREIVRPERIVRTELFEGKASETLATLVLTEENGKTTVTTKLAFPSREVRDAMLKSGMDRGVSHSYAQLDTLLAEGGAQSAA